MQVPSIRRLAVFLSRRMSLRAWDRMGILDRELAIYRRLSQRGLQISLITYGGRSERRYQPLIPEIQIVHNAWGLPTRLYERWFTRIHRRTLLAADSLKTNQLSGSELALRAACETGKPLVVRCGFVPSEVAAAMAGVGSREHLEAVETENRVWSGATRVVVTTERLANVVRSRRVLKADRVAVISNYVDTDQFVPNLTRSPDVDLLVVGRLSSEKNLNLLCEAIRPLALTLRVIGSGSEQTTLARRFRDMAGRIEWCGTVPHHRLPEYMNRARLFVLPSRVEGHPKALIEAMACGCPVLGTDVTGIRDVIAHGHNGWLCPVDAAAMRTAISTLLANPSTRKMLGENARRDALQFYSLDHVADRELQFWKNFGQQQITSRDAA